MLILSDCFSDFVLFLDCIDILCLKYAKTGTLPISNVPVCIKKVRKDTESYLIFTFFKE